MAKRSLLILLSILLINIKSIYTRYIDTSGYVKRSNAIPVDIDYKFRSASPLKFMTKEQKEKVISDGPVYFEDNDDISISALVSTTNFTFYEQLDEVERQIYDMAYDASVKSPPEIYAKTNITLESEVDFLKYYSNTLFNSIVKVFSALIYENPELWWLGAFNIMQYNPYPFEMNGKNYTNYELLFELNKDERFSLLSPEQIEEKNVLVEKAKDEIVDLVKELNIQTTYGIVKFIHNYFVTFMEYSTESIYNITVVGGLVEQKGVCEAYSECFQYLTRELGVNSLIARSLYHEWNYVEMDNGKYYVIDVTHDDPNTRDEIPVQYVPGYAKNIQYNYFLTGTEHVSNSTQKKFSDEYYHVLILNPFRYPGVSLEYPSIEKEDYVPTEKDLEDAKIVDKYFEELPVPSITARPKPTSTSDGGEKSSKTTESKNDSQTATNASSPTTTSADSGNEPNSGFSFKNYGLIILSNIIISLISFILI